MQADPAQIERTLWLDLRLDVGPLTADARFMKLRMTRLRMSFDEATLVLGVYPE